MKLSSLNDDVPAFRLLEALNADLPEAPDWEPEAIFDELEEGGVPTTERLQGKLMAALAVRDTDEFFLSPVVFENVCTTFGNLIALADILQEPAPRHMCWAMEEVKRIRKSGDRSLEAPGDDVVNFVAVVLNRAGFVTAPEQLAFAQEYLDTLSHNSQLGTAVKAKWSTISTHRLATTEVEEDPVGVQVSRLLECALYVKMRLDA